VPPTGADWLHEIKHDGYRLMVRRVAGRAHLFTRNGHDWAARYPAIGALRARSFPIDGEAVVADAQVSPRSTCWAAVRARRKRSSGR
jgi:ATP-dependent DNA ligase